MFLVFGLGASLKASFRIRALVYGVNNAIDVCWRQIQTTTSQVHGQPNATSSSVHCCSTRSDYYRCCWSLQKCWQV